MLTVDIDKRISIDDCLEHPWITQRGLNPADSTDGLTGAMGELDFSKRKVVRERTLLSSVNDVKVSRVVELEDHAVPVKVFEKNADGKRLNGSQAAKRDVVVRTHGHPAGVKLAAAVEEEEEEDEEKKKQEKKRKEERPADKMAAEVFMEMGGKGDQQLFADDSSSRYLPEEVPPKGEEAR